jgi:hypothetical protein
MIKTVTTIVSHRLVNSGEPQMLLSGAMIDGSFVLVFEFGSLGFV